MSGQMCALLASAVDSSRGEIILGPLSTLWDARGRSLGSAGREMALKSKVYCCILATANGGVSPDRPDLCIQERFSRGPNEPEARPWPVECVGATDVNG